MNKRARFADWKSAIRQIGTLRHNGGVALFVIPWLLAISHGLSAAEPAETKAPVLSPFFNLRESTLGYHGTEADFTNLTEIRLGWFGPTNLNDPLTGDLWWAADFAIREANKQQTLADKDGEREHTRPRVSRLAPSPAGPDTSQGVTGEAPVTAPGAGALPFRLVARWAVDPWGTGVSQLTRMVYDEPPLALLGSVDSATTHLAEQVVAKVNLPLVSPIATDKSITLAGVPWMFSCAPGDAAIARVLVDDILATLKSSASTPTRGSRRKEALTSLTNREDRDQSLLTSAATSERVSLALLVCTEHESRMTTREVLKELSRRGCAPDFRFDVPPGATDITRQLEAAVEARPAVVLIIAGAEDSVRLVQAVRTRLGNVTIFGSHSMGRHRFHELAGSTAEGVRFPLLFVPDSADTNTIRFVSQFISVRRHAPDYTAALTYDAARMLIEAIRGAGPNRARIREALAERSPWPGIAGPIRFDGTGQDTRTNLCMGTIRSGVVALCLAPHAPVGNSSKN